MSTVQEVAPPRRPDSLDLRTTRRRRRWPLILTASVVAVMVTAGGIAFWWVATRYTPMRPAGAPAHVRVEGGQITRVDSVLPSGQGFVAFHVPYRDGEWLDAGFTLFNEGPFPIIVDQIGFPGRQDDFPPIRQISVSISASGTDWGPAAPDQMVPFRPFTLRSDEGRYVFVRYQFFGCSLSGSQESAVTWAWQTVRFRMRVGWMTIRRSGKLPMGYSIYVSGREGCPE